MGISLKDFEALRARIPARQKGTVPHAENLTTPRPRFEGLVLGVDPSLRCTGYGVLRAAHRDCEAVVWGTIACPSGWERSRCLSKISQVLTELAAQHRPQFAAVEGLFFAQNLKTALIMGEARGAAIAAIATGGAAIYEIAPRKVKQAIVGYGGAQKLAVAKMVQRQLNLSELPEPDAADALAVALAFIQEQGKFALSGPKRV